MLGRPSQHRSASRTIRIEPRRTAQRSGTTRRGYRLGLVRGGHRDFEDRIRRDQFLASANYFVTRTGEPTISRAVSRAIEPSRRISGISAFPGDVLHVVSQRNAAGACIGWRHPRGRTAGFWAHAAYRQRCMARERSRHAESRRALRPVPPLSPRAGTSGRPIQSHASDLRRGRQYRRLERLFAAAWLHSRSHRRRANRRQIELQPVLGEPWSRHGLQRQSQRLSSGGAAIPGPIRMAVGSGSRAKRGALANPRRPERSNSSIRSCSCRSFARRRPRSSTNWARS